MSRYVSFQEHVYSIGGHGGAWRSLAPTKYHQAPSFFSFIGSKPPAHIDVNNVSPHEIVIDFRICDYVAFMFSYPGYNSITLIVNSYVNFCLSRLRYSYIQYTQYNLLAVVGST